MSPVGEHGRHGVARLGSSASSLDSSMLTVSTQRHFQRVGLPVSDWRNVREILVEVERLVSLRVADRRHGLSMRGQRFRHTRCCRQNGRSRWNDWKLTDNCVGRSMSRLIPRDRLDASREIKQFSQPDKGALETHHVFLAHQTKFKRSQRMVRRKFPLAEKPVSRRVGGHFVSQSQQVIEQDDTDIFGVFKGQD